MADADPLALDAPLLQQGFALFALKLFFGAVDPAAAQPQRGGGQHQVAHDKAAVLHSALGVGIGQHHQNGGRAVHGVAVLAHDGGVHAGELFPRGGVLHHHDLGALLTHGAGSIGAGTQNLAANKTVTDTCTAFAKSGKKVAAICAAPSVLASLGLLEGKNATAHAGFQDKLAGAHVLDTEVVVDGNITTSYGLGGAIPFALELVRQLAGQAEADRIRNAIAYRH